MKQKSVLARANCAICSSCCSCTSSPCLIIMCLIVENENYVVHSFSLKSAKYYLEMHCIV